MNSTSREWLLLMFEVPASRSNLRVKVWRRLQVIGAINLKGSVYALPKTPETEEDLAWIRQTLLDGGAEASLMTATHGSEQDKHFIRKFQEARHPEYLELGKALASFRQNLDRGAKAKSEDRLRTLRADLHDLTERYAAIRKRDFFPSRIGEDAKRQLNAIKGILEKSDRGMLPGASAPRGLDIREYRGKKWVTRAGMHVDRLASAWLIRKFIDPKARFGFVQMKNAQAVLPPSLPFDMEGAPFGHHEFDCTFETFLKAFGLGKDSALAALGEIIHDVDLKDGKYGRPESAGIDVLVRGLREEVQGDDELLESGMRFFDALYRALK